MKIDHGLPQILTWIETEWFNLYFRVLVTSDCVWIDCSFGAVRDKLKSVSENFIFFYNHSEDDDNGVSSSAASI